MELPIVCPCCKHPLLNYFREYPISKPHQLEKTCKIKPDHQFICLSKRGSDNEVNSIKITIDMNTMLTFNWVMPGKVLYFSSGFTPTKNIVLPYIEPDLENYKKLVKRLKNLVLFI